MRILHILDHGLPLQSGYTFRTRAILKAQEGAGHDVAAVTGVRQGAGDAAVETLDGLTFYRTPVAMRAGLVGEAAGLAAHVRAIDRAVTAFRPDILHAHSPVLDALAGLAIARRRRLPLVYEIRAFWEDAAVGNGTGTAGSARYRVTRAGKLGLSARRCDCGDLRRLARRPDRAGAAAGQDHRFAQWRRSGAVRPAARPR
ncbi:hypothetical protein GCM10020258_04820 [Sphingomonas yabuuchiae]